MDINTEITNQSWGNLGDDVAKNYLHYYPKQMKEELSRFISTISDNPKVLDIGCGNAQIYPILKINNPKLIYTGIDITDSLIRVAKEVVGDGDRVIKEDIFKYITNTNEKFNFGILSHMLECIESPDLIMGLASQKCDYIAIHWYDTPKYEYDAVTIAKNPHSEETFKPYLRRKMGKDYWSYIINRHNLELTHISGSGDNVLEIYKRK
jgi:2-polyprenyl-3-methyl-5-hydroxy-6-metoxy-1,4-benzoquinol methylase